MHALISQIYDSQHSIFMSIRQIRLNSIEQIRKRIGEFKGKTINVVLSNQTAMLGELKEIHDDAIILENRRLKKNRFLFDEISELYFDQIV